MGDVGVVVDDVGVVTIGDGLTIGPGVRLAVVAVEALSRPGSSGGLLVRILLKSGVNITHI